MSSSAFVYGTLMAPEVLKVLIARVPPLRPATLKGHMRCRVRGEVFPAIIPDAASEVRGQVSQPHGFSCGPMLKHGLTPASPTTPP
jgi:hypothetical protein